MEDLQKTLEVFGESGSMESPERNLWCAVIQRAYDDIDYYLKSNESNLTSYLEARRARTWILSHSTEPYSFCWAVESVFSAYEPSLRDTFMAKLRKFALRPLISP